METQAKKPRERIGILGGTFNPIHNRHLQMAESVRRQFHLSKVLLIVAKEPPHKRVEDAIPAKDRLAMVQLAAAGHACIEVSDVELAREGKSYTIDTLSLLQQRYPGAAFALIVGGDMLRDLPSWREAEALMHRTSIIGVPRALDQADSPDKGKTGEAAALLRERYGADVHLSDMELSPVSSTQIRTRAFDALPLAGLVPAAVERYIHERGLYQGTEYRALAARCKEALSKRRFHHTISVVITAIALAERYGVDGKKARLAALLHDYGRSVEWDALRHAAVGEALAREELGVRDEEVLRAIRLHTTLDVDATLLDKVVYLADMVEPGRDYPGVDDIRTLAREDLNAAVVLGLNRTISFLRERGIPVDETSLRAREAFIKATQSKD